MGSFGCQNVAPTMPKAKGMNRRTKGISRQLIKFVFIVMVLVYVIFANAMVAKLIFTLGVASKRALAQLSKVAPEVITSSTISIFLSLNREGVVT